MSKVTTLVLDGLVISAYSRGKSNLEVSVTEPGSKMCLKSPGTDVGAAGFERCSRTFETHFTLAVGPTL